jgi:hypothetical protein
LRRAELKRRARHAHVRDVKKSDQRRANERLLIRRSIVSVSDVLRQRRPSQSATASNAMAATNMSGNTTTQISLAVSAYSSR